MLLRELAARGWPQRLVVRQGHVLATRCTDVPHLEIREVASNPVAAGLAVRGCAVAHAHEARTVYSSLLANWLFRVPYVVTRRVVAEQSASAVRSAAYRRAGRVATVSRAAGEILARAHPELEYTVVPDATTDFVVNDNAVADIRAAHPGKMLIGHVGALDDSHKGQSTLIDVARIAADRRPDWHFLLCGDGPDEDRFRAEIGDLQNIELMGWVDNVGDFLASFDLFVYPSLHEALGSILLDAMSLGLPIVASNVGGIPEVIEDGVNGRLVDSQDPEQFFTEIGNLLAAADERAAMGTRNVEAAARYSKARMASSYETLYREILAPM